MAKRAVGLFFHRTGTHVRSRVVHRGEEGEHRLLVFGDGAGGNAAPVVGENPRFAVLLPARRDVRRAPRGRAVGIVLVAGDGLDERVAVVVDAGNQVARRREAGLRRQRELERHVRGGGVLRRHHDLPHVAVAPCRDGRGQPRRLGDRPRQKRHRSRRRSGQQRGHSDCHQVFHRQNPLRTLYTISRRRATLMV